MTLVYLSNTMISQRVWIVNCPLIFSKITDTQQVMTSHSHDNGFIPREFVSHWLSCTCDGLVSSSVKSVSNPSFQWLLEVSKASKDLIEKAGSGGIDRSFRDAVCSVTAVGEHLAGLSITTPSKTIALFTPCVSTVYRFSETRRGICGRNSLQWSIFPMVCCRCDRILPFCWTKDSWRIGFRCRHILNPRQTCKFLKAISISLCFDFTIFYGP